MRSSLPALCLFLTLFGCAELIEGGGHRTFEGEMGRGSDPYWIPGEDFSVVSGDEGALARDRSEIRARTPAGISKEEKNQQSLVTELNQRLQQISEEEYGEYREHAKYLENVSEKIYYLKLSRSSRWNYVAEKRSQQFGEAPRASEQLSFIQMRQERQDRELGRGMSKEEVIQRWGRPEQVDIAGDPRYENERWTFNEGSAKRQVFFENGSVQGWNVEN